MSAEDTDLVSPLPQVTSREDAEYQSWAQSLGVSPERVRDAVSNVGHSADAVRDWLARG